MNVFTKVKFGVRKKDIKKLDKNAVLKTIKAMIKINNENRKRRKEYLDGPEYKGASKALSLLKRLVEEGKFDILSTVQTTTKKKQKVVEEKE